MAPVFLLTTAGVLHLSLPLFRLWYSQSLAAPRLFQNSLWLFGWKSAIALYWKCPCFHPVRWKRLPFQGPPHCPSCSLRLLARSSICRVTVSFDKLMSRNFVFCSWHTRGILAFLHKFSITERLAPAGYFLNYHVASLCYSFTRFGQICENWWQCSLFQVGQAYWCAPHRWICCRFYDWYHNAVLCSSPWALH